MSQILPIPRDKVVLAILALCLIRRHRKVFSSNCTTTRPEKMLHQK